MSHDIIEFEESIDARFESINVRHEDGELIVEIITIPESGDTTELAVKIKDYLQIFESLIQAITDSHSEYHPYKHEKHEYETTEVVA